MFLVGSFKIVLKSAFWCLCRKHEESVSDAITLNGVPGHFVAQFAP